MAENDFIKQINIGTALTPKIFNLTVPDSIRRDITVEADSTFNFDAFFEKQDKWIKAEITQSALGAARGNVQTLNMFDDQLYNRKKTVNKYTMEKHKKFTLSLAVLIFFFIGAPLGAIIRKGGLGMPVVVSILLFIAYYIVSMTGEKSAREDVWDMFGGMWFSTFVFLPMGVWLTYKAANDAALMSAETYSKILNKLGLEKLTGKIRRRK